MNKSLIGHAIMCVRMKLRKDKRDLANRQNAMTPEQVVSVSERIDRGERTMAGLERMKSQQECKHTSRWRSPRGVLYCAHCGGEVLMREED